MSGPGRRPYKYESERIRVLRLGEKTDLLHEVYDALPVVEAQVARVEKPLGVGAGRLPPLQTHHQLGGLHTQFSLKRVRRFFFKFF